MTEPGPADDGDDVDVRRARAPAHRRLLRWIAENPMYAVAIPIAVGVCAVLVGAALGNENPEVPRWLRLAGVTALLTCPYWYLLGQKVVSILWSPSYVWLVQLRAPDPDVGGIARIPTEEYREFDVVEGSLDWVTPSLAFATDVDLEENELRGTWRGTLTDRDLLTALSAVSECRGQLMDDAKRGFVVESQAWTIIRNATRRATRRIVEVFEDGTLPERGDGLEAEIEAAISNSGLDELLDDETADDLDLPDDMNLADGQRLRSGVTERSDAETSAGRDLEDENRANGDGDLTVPAGRSLRGDR